MTQANPATSTKFRALAKLLDVEDARINTVLQTHINMPRKRWREREVQDLVLTASESVQYGLAQDILDFVVPIGSQLFNL